jgi:uncharacterized protein (DUF885 family)
MKTTVHRLWLLLGVALVAACGSGEPPSISEQTTTAPATAADIERETARLNEWLDARYEEELAFSPMEKTFQGRKDDYDKLDDVSEAAEDTQLEWRRGTADELRNMFNYDALTPEAQISYDLWVYQLERAEAALPFRRRGYEFTQRGGAHIQIPQFLINFHRVDEEADMTAYIARLGEAGRLTEQSLERAKLAAGEGVHAPRFAYEAVLVQARAVVTGAPFGGEGDAPLFADAKAKIDALVANGKIDAARAEELRAAAAAALTDRVKPAYDAVIAWVEADLANTDEVATGVWKLPDGPAFYAERLAAMTTTAMTADEVHELGLSEVARIQGEMEAIRQRVGFDGTLQELFAYVRKDPQFFFPSTDGGREAYLQAARDYLGVIEQRLPEYFGLLPKADLIVKRVEPFREEPGAAQHYFGGTPDGSRPGIYYAHLIDMSSMPKWDMESVAYHEGLPGHHMQISIAQELTGVPKFRTQLGVTAYSEGWGLYAEALAKEMGGYEDPYSDLGRLGNEIWRAVRLVVDTGLHAKRWTEEEAVAYFMQNAPTSEGQIRSEIQRYIVTPGQATAYKVGMLKIQELRARAEQELGSSFDIRGFHDAVLGGGALPLSILERRVAAWIASQDRG